MTQQLGFRETLLLVIRERSQADSGGQLQQQLILQEAAKRLGFRPGNPQFEEALLTQWNELFRTGLLAWGYNLSNPNPPFFHLTDVGQRALATVSRDPSNPAGYMRHLSGVAVIGPIGMAYLEQGLTCYVQGLFRAAAVMVGASAESVILDLRDVTVSRLQALGRTPNRRLEDRSIKVVTDALTMFLEGEKQSFPYKLREQFDSCWTAIAFQIRSVRNDAGHPKDLDLITVEGVHAALLVFPELAKLATELGEWIKNDLK